MAYAQSIKGFTLLANGSVEWKSDCLQIITKALSDIEYVRSLQGRLGELVTAAYVKCLAYTHGWSNLQETLSLGHIANPRLARRLTNRGNHCAPRRNFHKRA
jgi:hypothetical protein